jgi:site-specific recombinase
MTVGAKLTETYTAAQLLLGNAPGLGDHFLDKDGKWYKFVLFNNGAGNVASVAGNFAYYYLAGGAQDDEVTMDLSDSVNLGAGVFQAIIADGSYGWIQIMGKATLTTALTAGADGNALTAVGSTDGTLDVSALVTDVICAYADDISAKEVMLCCPW